MLDRKSLRGIGIWCAVLTSTGAIQALAQAPGQLAPGPADGVSQPAQVFSPEQLDNIVAPVTLYPDQLLGQVLAASTYPLELVAAQQWIQRANLQGVQLMDAARQQNWDPSVQALVAFPDVLTLLTRDVQWTTALGNAFLAQQADVMTAIQRMRARAQSNGRLQSGPQQIVQTQYQDGQNAIAIQPASPQMMYVPSYDPQYVWGPPARGEYPQLGYPSFGQIFGTVVNLAGFFLGFGGLLGGGLGLLGGPWGWALNWFTHSILLNGLFFGHLGFHGGGYGGGGFYGGGYGARSAWVHDPGHRLGVPYSNAAVASRFGGTFRAAGFGSHENFGSGAFASRGPASGGWRTMGGAGERGFGAAPGSQAFSSSRGFNSFAGNGTSAWHSSSPGGSYGRSPGGPGSTYASNFRAGSGFGESANRGFGESNRGFGERGYASSGFRSGPSSPGGFGSSFASPNRSLAQNQFGGGGASHFSQQRVSEPRASSQHFSAPKAQHFSAPKMSAPKMSHSGGHSSGGHGGGGHSHGGSHKH